MLPVLSKTWYTWYLNDADSYSKILIQILISFLGKFGPKLSKLSVSTENWQIQCLENADSESRLRFLKFRPQNPPKIQNCPFCLEISAQGISRMLILNPDLDFSNFDPKIHFCANLGPKPPSCPFCLMVYMVS